MQGEAYVNVDTMIRGIRGFRAPRQAQRPDSGGR